MTDASIKLNFSSNTSQFGNACSTVKEFLLYDIVDWCPLRVLASNP